ncbi:hypothetical protein CIPAW_01G181500 [Carya illinoinensis]|uniref:Uncharacterized protein n=1 Tax=Carya illinoinensis TaxID=32201 RepID=A0A8T1RRQ3_CARIL|nr:hypothetical protein CIPAW_01G181500 [Carya illinoinensis]
MTFNLGLHHRKPRTCWQVTRSDGGVDDYSACFLTKLQGAE